MERKGKTQRLETRGQEVQAIAPPKSRRHKQMVWSLVWLAIAWLWAAPSWAGPLSDRLAAFPDWRSKPPTEAAVGDLGYPAWIAGDWDVTTTLVDLAAPLAPKITTPGFEGNRQQLGQPITFRVRFGEAQAARSPWPARASEPIIVADRAFNGLSLARAYLGDAARAVLVDPENPNRQITRLAGDRQLVSIVSRRATEAPDPDTFVTTEIFQQRFGTAGQLYFNEVETTTAYRHADPPGPDTPPIEADQVTAIYLSPQDPQFFEAGDRPVALYRYRLVFQPVGDRVP